MNTPEPINKPLVGVIGLVCLVTAGVCFLWFPDQTSAQSACLRIGVVMTALYFALPKPGQHVRWERFVPMLVALIFLIVVSKRMILVILPMLAVIGIILAVFRPRQKVRPPRGRMSHD